MSSLSELRAQCSHYQPRTGFILGSGMGEVIAQVDVKATLPFSAIPQIGAATVQGHRGQISLGIWADKPVLIFEGRVHYYEGHSWQSVVWPVMAAHGLGMQQLILTNAAGGIRSDLQPGSIMGITNHIQWTKPLCWKQPGNAILGQQSPSPYSSRLLTLLRITAEEIHVPLQQGVYASVTGPTYETPAEIRALKWWGANAVGMSTAREVETGHQLGMECAALSLITNAASGLSEATLDHKEVLTMARTQSETLGRLFAAFLQSSC